MTASYKVPNTRKEAESLALTDTLRFDGSDLVDGEVGTAAFLEGILNLACDNAKLDTALTETDSH